LEIDQDTRFRLQITEDNHECLNSLHIFSLDFTVLNYVQAGPKRDHFIQLPAWTCLFDLGILQQSLVHNTSCRYFRQSGATWRKSKIRKQNFSTERAAEVEPVWIYTLHKIVRKASVPKVGKIEAVHGLLERMQTLLGVAETLAGDHCADLKRRIGH